MGMMITANPEPRPPPAPGKTVVGRRYLHVAAMSGLDDATRARVDQAETVVGLTRGDGYNVLRLERGCAAVVMDAVKDLIAMLDGSACTSSN